MSHVKLIVRQLLMTLGTILLGVGTMATLANASAYIFTDAAYGEFFGPRDPSRLRYTFAMLHIVPAALALMIGPLQFSKFLRRTTPILHRSAGTIYVLCVLISGAASLSLAPHAIGGAQAMFGFGTLAILWLVTTLGGLTAAITGQYQQHRNWMLRSFVLTCAGVLFRIELITLEGLAGWDYDSAYRFGAWACWLPSLILLEVWIRARRVETKGEMT